MDLVEMQYELIQKGWKDDLLQKPASELNDLMRAKQQSLLVGRGRRSGEAGLAQAQGKKPAGDVKYLLDRHHATTASTPGAKFGGMGRHGVPQVRRAKPGAAGNPKPTLRMRWEQRKAKKARSKPGFGRGDVNPNATGQYAQALQRRIDDNPNMRLYRQKRGY